MLRLAQLSAHAFVVCVSGVLVLALALTQVLALALALALVLALVLVLVLVLAQAQTPKQMRLQVAFGGVRVEVEHPYLIGQSQSYLIRTRRPPKASEEGGLVELVFVEPQTRQAFPLCLLPLLLPDSDPASESAVMAVADSRAGRLRIHHLRKRVCSHDSALHAQPRFARENAVQEVS